MHFSTLFSATLVLLLATTTAAYRHVQFVKHTGQSGRADQAFSLVNYYNATTDQSDLYIRMWMFRYGSSNKGWASLGLGPQMKGAFMFIIYGDPNTNELTLTVRTVDGHHPPRPLDETKDLYSGDVPDVEILRTGFEPYTGNWFSQLENAKPSHLGIAEFIVRGYEKFTAPALGISNDTAKQAMIWSSNFKQDFNGDFSFERAIDMHQFGLGFGFLWADYLNARSETGFFAEIDELENHSGIVEVFGEPPAPTEEELKKGEEMIAAASSGGDTGTDTPAAPGDGVDKQQEGEDSSPPATDPNTDPSPDSDTSKPGADDGSEVEAPVKNVKQWNIRSWMWHMHGLLMTLAFLVGYPMAIYLLRSPRTTAAGTAFNHHWTLNSLSSICVSIGSVIGFLNSRSISIPHQFLGILLVCALATQTVLGWRHHVRFAATGGRKTWMSSVHVGLGRVILPMGMVNVILGLMLRRYGWLIISLCVALAVVEIVVLTLVVGQARNRRPGGMQKGAGVPTADGAEEYFQLTGDDDDEFSDDEVEGLSEERMRKEAEREEQRRKLAKLDRV